MPDFRFGMGSYFNFGFSFHFGKKALDIRETEVVKVGDSADTGFLF